MSPGARLGGNIYMGVYACVVSGGFSLGPFDTRRYTNITPARRLERGQRASVCDTWCGVRRRRLGHTTAIFASARRRHKSLDAFSRSRSARRWAARERAHTTFGE